MNGNVLLYPGDGAGNFGAPASFPVGTSPTSISVADFNADGRADLAVANTNSNSVSILLGKGAGGFGATGNFAAGQNPSSVAAGDFNGDSKLDVVVANNLSQNVSILLGDGAGGFAAAQNFAAGSGPQAVAVADFNADAKLDLAVANFQQSNPRGVSILFGHGTGKFTAPTHFSAGSNPVSVVAGDFNNDTTPDVAVANFSSQSVSLMLNTCGLSVQPPSLSINDAQVTEGDAGTLNAAFTITLSAASPLTVTVNYSTADHTATGGTDYQPINGRLSFAPGELAKSFPVAVIGDTFAEGQEAFKVNISNPVNATIARAQGTGTIHDTDQPVIEFTSHSYIVDEGAKSSTVKVVRRCDVSGAASVFYETVSGSASERTDFAAARGTLHFAAGETTKSVNVFITDDVYAEDAESLTVLLSNLVGGERGNSQPAVLVILDNDTANGANPVKDASFDSAFFVRQHYIDFFNREPDAPGLAFWRNQIDECTTQACREVRRINVSAAFFLSGEFQQTGYLVYRFHQAAFNTRERLQLRDFLSDTQQIGRGVIVGQDNWQQQLEQNKQAFVAAFIQRQEFLSQYPLTLDAAGFIDKLKNNLGGTLTAAERDSLVQRLQSGELTRGSALRELVEDAEFVQAEFNRAFVLMQYFGYLRRNPDALPNTDFSGYNFWLQKLNDFNGNYINAEMVKAFITTGEYQRRFGQ